MPTKNTFAHFQIGQVLFFYNGIKAFVGIHEGKQHLVVAVEERREGDVFLAYELPKGSEVTFEAIGTLCKQALSVEKIVCKVKEDGDVEHRVNTMSLAAIPKQWQSY